MVRGEFNGVGVAMFHYTPYVLTQQFLTVPLKQLTSTSTLDLSLWREIHSPKSKITNFRTFFRTKKCSKNKKYFFFEFSYGHSTVDSRQRCVPSHNSMEFFIPYKIAGYCMQHSAYLSTICMRSYHSSLFKRKNMQTAAKVATRIEKCFEFVSYSTRMGIVAASQLLRLVVPLNAD